MFGWLRELFTDKEESFGAQARRAIDRGECPDCGSTNVNTSHGGGALSQDCNDCGSQYSSSAFGITKNEEEE